MSARTMLVVSAMLIVACGDPAPSPSAAGTSGAAAPASGSTSELEEPQPGTTVAPAGSSSDSGEETSGSTSGAQPEPEPAQMLLMDTVVFYDGYAETVDAPTPEGIVRLSNAVNAVKLTDAQLDRIQPNLQMQVLIGALCDNYDRIGSVNVALTEKGVRSYDPAEVPRLEIARFITPFMNKNQEPDTVPYDWDIDAVAAFLRDPGIRERYDVWFELDVFGVPYAANDEVSGCEGRNDVFRGWLALRTDSTEAPQVFDTLIPIAAKEAFNDYQDGASDAIGTTRKSLSFALEQDTQQVQAVLITSNHGANAGGEEYERREHFVYVDETLVLEYRPGRTTCEPFREYNTQSNGIYGSTPRTDEEWQSFSNWCPGDVIDTRIIELGPMTAGEHAFVIDVPDAEFAGDQGDFPFSLYLQAR